MKISTEELNELLQKEFERGRQSMFDYLRKNEQNHPIDTTNPITTRQYNFEDYIPQACRTCPKHPSNGGDGICHCTLGSMPIYSVSY